MTAKKRAASAAGSNSDSQENPSALVDDAPEQGPEPLAEQTREQWRAALFDAVDEYNAASDGEGDRLELVEPIPAPAEAGGEQCPLEFGVQGMTRPVPCELREGHDLPHAHTVTWAPAEG